MISITINEILYVFKLKLTVLETCVFVGENIPRFCYHELLSVSGNCRMCLVEIDESEKPIVSCVTTIKDEMNIYTNTSFIKKSRETILESILLNHPLDCPICDQAGECDLQEQTKYFGSKSGKFFYSRREVEDKNCGILIKTIMTRCIHCTRCVRFGEEIVGTRLLGTFNRGSSTEIGNYIPKIFESEISGTVIDLCPVGALTSNPYSFELRPWELKCLESIDLTDGLGSNIFIYFRNSQIYRIVPKNNKNINSNFISDKSRFSHDSKFKISLLKNQNYFTKLNSFINLINKIDNKILIHVNEEIDLKLLDLLKSYSFSSRIKVVSYNKNEYNNFINSNLFDNIDSLKYNKSLSIFFTTNVKIECAVLNTLLKLKSYTEKTKFFSIGNVYKNDLSISFLNINYNSVVSILEGKLLGLSVKLLNSLFPFFLIGTGTMNLLNNINSLSVYLKSKLNSLKLIQVLKYSNSEGTKYINIPFLNKKINLKSNLSLGVNLDDTVIVRKNFNNSKLNCIWINNTDSELSLKKFKNIINTKSVFCESEVHINLEQRPQKTEVLFEDSNNIHGLNQLFIYLFSLKDLKKKKNYLNWVMEVVINPKLFNINNFRFNNNFIVDKNITYFSKYPVKSYCEDFYSSNKYTRNSYTMELSSSLKRRNSNNFLISNSVFF